MPFIKQRNVALWGICGYAGGSCAGANQYSDIQINGEKAERKAGKGIWQAAILKKVAWGMAINSA